MTHPLATDLGRVLLLGVSMTIHLRAQPVPETEMPGTPWVGAVGIQESTADIMRRNARRESFSQAKVRRPRLAANSGTAHEPIPNTDLQLPVWKAGLAVTPGPARPLHSPLAPQAGMPDSPTPANAQSLGIRFTGATLGDASGFPPDPMGAAGPRQFLVVINGRVRTFNKFTGIRDGVLDTTTDSFFDSVMTPPVSNNFTSDPRVRYDRLSGRWFITMIDVPGMLGSLPNRVMIAVSDSGTLTRSTVWTFFQFQQDLVSATGDSNLFADYPTLGIDANALYIGVNIFGKRGDPTAFNNTTLFVVRKNALLSAGPIVATAFRALIKKNQGINTGPYTPQGVDNYDPAATEGYVIGVDTSVFGRLDLRRISNPGATPSISGNISLSTAATAEPMTVPHLGNTGGTSGYLDGLDYRLLAAHIRNGRLWTSQNIAVNNTGATGGTSSRNAVRWYELQGIASGQTPAVVQSGTLFQSSASNTTDQRHYWMGTIMVSGQGHAAMGFSVAGANEHINAGTAGRLAGDPPGTMQTPVLYTASSTSYNPPDDTGGPDGRRWGDYSYTCLDPNDDMTMWTIQEYCYAVNSYAVCVTQLLAPPPATPLSCSPPSVAAGANNVSVVLTGASANGSGFFDPGPGFSNHVAAVVNGGGVTMNSVSYVDPTHLTLNFSVAAGAVIGSRSITATNPDGQYATSSFGILAVVSSSTSNGPPTLLPIADRTLDEQSLLSVTASASDPDGDPLTFSLDAGAPAGAGIDATTGVLTWTPSEAQGPGSYAITVRVMDDGTPALSDAKTFMVSVNEVNSAPILAAIPDQIVLPGSQLALTNSATDADLPANVLTFSMDPGAPPGATINPASGRFTWLVPTNQVAGTFAVTIHVADDGVPSLNDSRTFKIVVVTTPVIESIVLADGTVTISWSAFADRTYRVQYKSDLNDSGWIDLAGDVVANGPVATKTDMLVSSEQRYYRVVLVP